jgi:outer membrane receptor protein involved in Fe transport
MSCRLAPPWLLVLMLSMFAVSSDADGQQAHVSSRGPRFLLADWSAGRELDASAAPVLRQRVSLDLSEGTIGEALKEITRQADLEIFYSPRVVPLDRLVSLEARDITVAAALTEILLDVPVDVSITESGGLALVPRAPVVEVPLDTGAVVGQVSDSDNRSPIAGATVAIEGTQRSVVTDAAGRYRIGGLAVGTYTVRARYIGYRPASVSVIVTGKGEATGDLVLVKAVQQLEQVVVTGTIVPTEVKALPTPISVIDEKDIALQRPQTIQELFRQAVPTGVSWNQVSAPYSTTLSARGASTLSLPSGQMKVFIDGIEAAWASQAGVDPNSIARVEVIRGPQAAAIYGSDAIGGVVQIFTKRGELGLTRPQLYAQTSLGLVQTPYSGYQGVVQQNYAASVRSGGGDMSYNIGAGYSRLSDYLPNGEKSAQSNPSAYGGMRFARGALAVDLSGRYYTQDAPSVYNPEVLQAGFLPFSKPNYAGVRIQNQTVGLRIGVSTTSWWQHTITVGVDRYSQELVQSRQRLTSPDDTLLQLVSYGRTKTSIGYSTAVQGSLSQDVIGSLTLGLDHYSLPIEQWSTFGALNTSGSIRLASGNSISASRSTTNNTGYFGQLQVGFREALFLTAGLRAEKNTDFGDRFGTPVSPRLGVSYVPKIGSVALKLRTSYGRAIRPPAPGQKAGIIQGQTTILPNELLGPEKQKGWDAGAEIAWSSRASLSVTYFNQTADDLIQLVLLQATSPITQQNQNVGRVKNSGVELEGTLQVGPAQLRAQYGYVRSRIVELGPDYTGDLRPGDQSLVTPEHSLGAGLTIAPRAGSTFSAGLIYVGSWHQTDLLGLLRCFGGTGQCQPSSRDYIVTYPGFVKLNASVWQQLTAGLSGFVSVENLTNNQAYEDINFFPVMGRTSTVGLRLQY